ncbi:ricin-type beta-trefoil lectin domain protein [Streptomyces sp. NPDC048340]|uniref:ricin-type beta-trefoil lectin domain protein n=1 Tax=Streptomyces sp. NPDC048340 TaxID=3365537 RepID=UPI00371972CA
MPKAHWKLTGQTGTTTPSATGDYPATTAGISFPSAQIGSLNTAYAAFTGASSTIKTNTSVVDARQSFTITAWVMPGQSSAIFSQDNNRNSAFALFADPDSKSWRFAMARSDTDGSNYDWTGVADNTASRYVPGAWQRVTVVFNADTSLMSLYVNGALSGTGHHQAPLGAAPVGPFVLGRYKQNGKAEAYHEGLTGGISNLAVYPYAASPAAPGTTTKISLTASGARCLDFAPDGVKAQIWDCNEINGGGAQKFEIRGDGTIRIQGKCMDATSAGTANGTPIQLYQCHSHPAQQFLPRADGSIYNPASGRCVDASNMSNGTQLYLWECNNTSPQRWTIPALSTAPLPVPTT